MPDPRVQPEETSRLATDRMRGVPLRSRMLRLGLLALILLATGNLLAKSFFDPIPGLERWLPFIDHWKLFQYQLSYADLGFVRRGLIGTLLGVGPDAAPPVLLVLALVPALVLSLAFVWLLIRVDDPRLAFALAASPALFMNFGFDMGRFDQINYLLMVIGMLRPGWSVAFLCPLILLVHEASIAIQIPLLLLFQFRERGAAMSFRIAVLATGLALAALMLLGREHALAELTARYALANPDSLRVLTRSLGSNSLEVWDYANNRMRLELQVAFLVPAVYLAVLAFAYLTLAGQSGRLFLLAALSPLTLSFVGFDFARWFGLAAVNLILLICLVAQRREAPRLPGWTILVFILFALPGPLGLVYPYPLAFVAL